MKIGRPYLTMQSCILVSNDDLKKNMCVYIYIYAAAKSLHSCPTLCDPIDGSPPGFPIPGFLQARTLEWGAISFSNAWKWKVKVKLLSRVRLLATSWTAAYQAPLSMGFSRQKYWSGVPLPSPVYTHMHTHIYISVVYTCMGFPGGSVMKNLPANAGAASSIPGSGISPGGGNGNPLQYYCQENPMDRGACTVCYSSWGCKESDPTEQLSMHTHRHRHTNTYIYIVYLARN